MEEIEDLLVTVFGVGWNQDGFHDGAMYDYDIIWPLSFRLIVGDCLSHLFDFIEDNQLQDPVFVFENDVFFTFVQEQVEGFTVSEVSPSGKEGMLFGYPYVCRSGFFKGINDTGLAVVDRDSLRGSYITYRIQR